MQVFFVQCPVAATNVMMHSMFSSCVLQPKVWAMCLKENHYGDCGQHRSYTVMQSIITHDPGPTHQRK